MPRPPTSRSASSYAETVMRMRRQVEADQPLNPAERKLSVAGRKRILAAIDRLLEALHKEMR